MEVKPIFCRLDQPDEGKMYPADRKWVLHLCVADALLCALTNQKWENQTWKSTIFNVLIFHLFILGSLALIFSLPQLKSSSIQVFLSCWICYSLNPSLTRSVRSVVWSADLLFIYIISNAGKLHFHAPIRALV